MIYKCNLKESCKRCGNCCRFRLQKSNLTKDEEIKLRKAFYEKKSVIYPYDLRKITISITQKEKERLETLAEKKGIEIRIIPNKVKIFPTKDNQIAIKISDYFIDHDICPFLDQTKNRCTIYNNRPNICKDFPLSRKSTIIPNQKPILSFEKALQLVKEILCIEDIEKQK